MARVDARWWTVSALLGAALAVWGWFTVSTAGFVVGVIGAAVCCGLLAWTLLRRSGRVTAIVGGAAGLAIVAAAGFGSAAAALHRQQEPIGLRWSVAETGRPMATVDGAVVVGGNSGGRLLSLQDGHVLATLAGTTYSDRYYVGAAGIVAAGPGGALTFDRSGRPLSSSRFGPASVTQSPTPWAASSDAVVLLGCLESQCSATGYDLSGTTLWSLSLGPSGLVTLLNANLGGYGSAGLNRVAHWPEGADTGPVAGQELPRAALVADPAGAWEALDPRSGGVVATTTGSAATVLGEDLVGVTTGPSGGPQVTLTAVTPGATARRFEAKGVAPLVLNRRLYAGGAVVDLGKVVTGDATSGVLALPNLGTSSCDTELVSDGGAVCLRSTTARGAAVQSAAAWSSPVDPQLGAPAVSVGSDTVVLRSAVARTNPLESLTGVSNPKEVTVLRLGDGSTLARVRVAGPTDDLPLPVPGGAVVKAGGQLLMLAAD